ncbi:MAG: group II intron maturase-specific domain-containing protein [Cyanobium sp.]
MLEALQDHFASCGLQLRPQKTQVVYCRDGRGRAPFPAVQFTFLGYAFRPRMAKSSRGVIFANFSPTVSPQLLKRMRERVKAIGLLPLVHLSIEEIARTLNPVLQGWIQYYSRFYKTELISKLYRYLDYQIAA